MASLTRRQFLAGLGLGGVAAGIAAAVRIGGGGSATPPGANAATAGPAAPTTKTPVATSPPPPPTTSTTTTSASTTTTSTASASTTTTTGPTPPTARVVEVIGRQAWGAVDPRGGFPAHTVERITVHHTAARLDDNTAAPGRLRGYQRFHQDSGFADLAYHLSIDGNGNVYEGRDPTIAGETFTDYDPTGHFLVVLDGNFDRQQVPAAQLEALADVVAWATAEFGAGLATVGGHRDYAATSCPGRELHAAVADGTLDRLAGERLAAGGIDLAVLPPDRAAARVAEIEAGRA